MLYMTHATRALQSNDLSGEGINSRSHTCFLTTEGHEGPPRMRDQLNAGATSETTGTWNTIDSVHAPIHSNKTNMKGWLWRPDDIRGSCGLKASWHSLTGEEKLRKNLSQETCPDRGSNPVLLRMLYSGEHLEILIFQINFNMRI